MISPMPPTPSDADNPSPEAGRYVGPETTDRISALLLEHSDRLKDASRELDYRQFRQIVVLSAYGATALLYAFMFRSAPLSTNGLFALVLSLLLVGTMLATTIQFEVRRIFALRSRVRSLADHLEKAVRAASQIEEHAERDLGRRLELDLRLAEAETLLRYVHHQTGRKE